MSWPICTQSPKLILKGLNEGVFQVKRENIKENLHVVTKVSESPIKKEVIFVPGVS